MSSHAFIHLSLHLCLPVSHVFFLFSSTLWYSLSVLLQQMTLFPSNGLSTWLCVRVDVFVKHSTKRDIKKTTLSKHRRGVYFYFWQDSASPADFTSCIICILLASFSQRAIAFCHNISPTCIFLISSLFSSAHLFSSTVFSFLPLGSHQFPFSTHAVCLALCVMKLCERALYCLDRIGICLKKYMQWITYIPKTWMIA